MGDCHAHRESAEYTREPMAFRIWGEDLSLNRFYLIQDNYYIPQTHQVKSQVCCGCAPNHNSFDRLVAVKLFDGIWCNFESLIRAVFAEHVQCFPYIAYIGHCQSKSQEWLQLHRFE